MSDFSYRDYVADQSFMKDYSDYQKKYASTIRDSDRVIIDSIRKLLERDLKESSKPELLDIGCSTGNLLLHIKRMLPTLSLTGGDMVPQILDECRKNPDLTGTAFEEMNVLDLGFENRFDIVVVNAVLYMLAEDEFRRALSSISKGLKRGGWLLAFDFFHPYEQDLSILEVSVTHPKGLMLHFRPFEKAESALSENGFRNVAFEPFKISIDLPKPEAFSDLGSYTRTAGNERLLFRGTLFQPWCHLLAQKA